MTQHAIYLATSPPEDRHQGTGTTDYTSTQDHQTIEEAIKSEPCQSAAIATLVLL
jgi:hypothetical protein